MIYTAKPRDKAAAAREHRRVFAPLLRATITEVTSPCHMPGKIVLEVIQRNVFLPHIKGEMRQVHACRPVHGAGGAPRHAQVLPRGQEFGAGRCAPRGRPRHPYEAETRHHYPRAVPQRLRHRLVLLEQRDRPSVVPRAVVADPEASARIRHPRAVPQLLRHRLVLPMHLARSRIVPRALVAAPEVAARRRHPRAVPQLLRHRLVLLMHLCGSSSRGCTTPPPPPRGPPAPPHRLALLMQRDRPHTVPRAAVADPEGSARRCRPCAVPHRLFDLLPLLAA